MGSSPDTNVMTLMRMVVNRSVSETFQSSSFQRVVEEAVSKCPLEPYVANDVTTNTIELQTFKLLVTKFVKNEIERRSIQKAKLAQYETVLDKAIMGHMKKKRD